MQRPASGTRRRNVHPRFDDVVAAEAGGLIRYATALCGDPEQARDLVQDVLARAFVRWDRIGATDRPAAYLMRMVTNQFLSWRRRWSTRSIVLVDDAELTRTADPTRRHEDVLSDRDELERRLARLPRRQQAALVLRYYEGLDYSEVAAVLGCAEGTARSACSRGLAALRLDQTSARLTTPGGTMTTVLTDVLTERADRAGGAFDVDDLLSAVRVRAAERAHRRRRAVAAGGGAAIAMAAVVVVAGSVAQHPHPATRPSDAPAAAGPTAADHAPVISRIRAADALRAQAARAARLRAAQRAQAAQAGLVPVDPAPPTAEVSLGLVPRGWGYLGASDAATTYGPASGTNHDPNDFVGKLAVLVGERYDRNGSFPLTIAGRPGRLDGPRGSDTTIVTVPITAKVEVTIQVPHAAGLDHDQILRLAETLDVRSTAHYGVG